MLLKDYFPLSTHHSKPLLDQVLNDIHNHTGFFSYIAHVKSGRYSHTSPSFEKLTGYSVSLFEEESIDFYMKRVPPEDILNVVARQAATFTETTLPGFNPELPNFVEMKSRFLLANGKTASNVALATAFAYLPTGEFEFALVGVYVETEDTTHNVKVRAEMASLLTAAKKLYREVYPQPPFNKNESPLTEIVFEVQPNHALTTKEKEVLKKIVLGLSTKQIAKVLNISEHTVDSHRKNMLRKLQAKNVAELVKKASKLYWLE